MQRAKGTDRILDILDFFENSAEAVTRNAIANAISCPRSTLYPLVDTLIERGWLVQGADGTIALGSRAARLGLAYTRSAKFETIAREILTKLAKAVGEVVEFNIVDNWKQLVVLSATTKEHTYLRAVEGTSVPAPATAAARVQLADFPTNVISKKIPKRDFTLNSGHVITIDEFITDIEKARTDGYFIAYRLIEDYVSTIAMPVWNRQGERIGAVSIVMPTSRIEKGAAHFVEQLGAAAEQITDVLKLTSWDFGQKAYNRLKASDNQ